MRKEFYEQIWDILVEYAGASKGADNKELFVLAFIKGERVSTHEYRFGGLLGAGGKFWHYNRSPYSKVPFYVTYYPEDHSPKRDKVVEKVNALITSLYELALLKDIP
jgi:hypothetical protein